MSGTVRPVYLHPATQAQALGAALARLGFTAEVLTARPHQQHPCVVVDAGPARLVDGRGFVYAAPDQDGCWWFWWPDPDDPLTMAVIAPLSEVSVAADAIDRALARARAVFSHAG